MYRSLFIGAELELREWAPHHLFIDGLVQNRNNSIANALELLQSRTKPSISNFILNTSNRQHY